MPSKRKIDVPVPPKRSSRTVNKHQRKIAERQNRKRMATKAD
jgi:hypothetical protein